MRCPQCQARNSVAAPKCQECGTRFPRKPLPVKLFAAVGAVVVLLVVSLIACAIVPMFFDPEGNLNKIAKKVAAGPKSVQDAERITAELEDAAKRYIEKNTELSSKDLGDKLRKIFPNSAYEINCFDLPSNLKLVEIDTVLQASDYLIRGKSVTVLRGFEVFDTAKTLSDSSGPVIVLAGHRNAQAGRRPQIRLFSLADDSVKEKPQDAVPKFTGEGTSSIGANGNVALDLSLASRAVEERLFKPEAMQSSKVADENVKLKLLYKDGKYELQDDNGRGPLAALRAVAFVIADQSAKPRFMPYLSDKAQSDLAAIGKIRTCPPEFSLRRKGGTVVAQTAAAAQSEPDDNKSSGRRHRHRRHHNRENVRPARAQSTAGGLAYNISNSDDSFDVTLAKSAENGGLYKVVGIQRVKNTAIAQAPVAVKGEDSVPYQDRTASLVDKLLDSPEPILPTTDKTPKVAVATSVESDSTKMEPKVIEKHVSGESGSISSNSPSVKVRSGPGTHFGSITEIKKGAQVEVVGKQDGWYKVKVNGREGFVYGGFVACTTSDAYTTATVTKNKSIKDERNHTVSHAETGDKLVILGGIGNDRYKVQLASGRIGYVDKDALRVSGEAGDIAPMHESHEVHESRPAHESSDAAPQFVP